MFFDLRKTKIKTRLYVLLAINIVLLLVPFMKILSDYKQDLMENKQVKTLHLVQTVHDVLGHYYLMETQGKLSRSDAQMQAKETIKKIRYGDKDYFWINDLTPTMIMHPFKPQLDGKNLSAVKDPTGKSLFLDMVRVSKSSGGGVVHYMWPKPGSDGAVEKTSYVKLFKPWGWVIGTGIYVDDVDAIVMAETKLIMSYGFIIIVILIILSSWIGRSITKQCDMTRKALNDIADGDGDLTKKLSVVGNDEFSQISKVFNLFVTKMRTAISHITPISERVTKLAGDMDMIAREFINKSSSQKEAINSVTSEMDQLQDTNYQVASSAEDAVESAGIISQKSNEGSTLISEASEYMISLSDKLNETADNTRLLAEDAEAVGSVLEVIRGVSEQTNLLALNAAIEAARAGEQGRGFAVVADEVRTLATRTKKSTDEIEQIISALQKRAEGVRLAMDDTKAKSHETQVKTGNAHELLREIDSQIQTVLSVNQTISSACSQQSVASQEVSKRLSDILEHSTDVSGNAESLSKTSDELLDNIQLLNKNFGVFKV